MIRGPETRDEPGIVEVLRRPAAWATIDPEWAAAAGADHRAELIETHGARLLLTPRHVAKIKKPVDLKFFDFTAPERRRFYCAEEVRLNRRLAPDVYLGVAPVLRRGEGRHARWTLGVPHEPDEALVTGSVDGPDEHVIDHAILMRRLPAADMLDARLAAGTVDGAEIDAIADRIAAFQAGARRGPDVDAMAGPAAVRDELSANAGELVGQLAGLGDDGWPRSESSDPVGGWTLGGRPRRDVAAALKSWLERFVGRDTETFRARIAAGRAIDGHGDLHAGNICLGAGRDGGPAIFDCIEFMPAYRCGDVVRDLAFLAADLERRGASAFARRLVERWRHASGEGDGADAVRLQRIFTVHYAAVRAKVDLIRLAQLAPEGRRHEGEDLRTRIRDWMRVAVRRAIGPRLIVMCGRPGSGKSTVAAAIAREIDAEHIQSDVVRKQLHGIEPTTPTPRERRDEVYGAAATAATGARMLAIAAPVIAAGRAVVLDATHGDPDRRSAVRAAAGAMGAEGTTIVFLDEDPDELAARVARRARTPGAISDATPETWAAAAAGFVAPDDGPGVVHVGGPGAGEGLAAVINAWA